MPLKGSSAAAEKKAEQTVEQLSKNAKFSGLRKTTETISARVPTGEADRLRSIFAKSGYTLAQAIKIAVYHFAQELEEKKRHD
ncbi:hypothetical protein FACS1894172_09180 [Spirochaetia bacterium]|nr:hypothetical protein FACS1894172_09180 [Spirochaetia bacterium]